MTVSIIAAIGKNRELGKDNKLLWHISEDLIRFKKITQGHIIIMGRKTYESIGKPLPNRTNYIITRDYNYKVEGASVFHSIEEAIKSASAIGDGEIFIIGGGQLYNQAINIADKLYLTLVDREYDADTFFPDYSMFKNKVFEQMGESDGLKYTFLELKKRS